VTYAPSSDGTYDVGNIKVEEDVDEIEEVFLAIKKEVDIGIKQEEIVGDRSFPDINAETDEVCYVCMCMYIIRHNLNVSRIVSFLCHNVCLIETTLLLECKYFAIIVVSEFGGVGYLVGSVHD
jgi:hypothetical protein